MAAVAEPAPLFDLKYHPEVDYDAADIPDPTLADEIGGLLSCLERIASTLSIDDIHFKDPKVDHNNEAYAKLAVDYGDGITWALMDIEKYARSLPLGTEAIASLKSWQDRAQAQWKLADVHAAEHLKRGEFTAAVWLVHSGCVRLRTGTLRIELTTLIEDAIATLPGAGSKPVKKPSKRSRRSPKDDAPYIKPNTDNLMAIEVFNDVRKAGFTLDQWAKETGKSKSTISESRVWKLLSEKHKLTGGHEFHSAEPAGPRMADGRQVIRREAHRSEYERGSRD